MTTKQNNTYLHTAIMDLPCAPKLTFDVGNHSYKRGHRDARHAAAELVAGYEARQEDGRPDALSGIEPFFYYRVEADGSIQWGEDCIYQNDAYSGGGGDHEFPTHGGKVYSEAQVRAIIAAARPPAAPVQPDQDTDIHEALQLLCAVFDAWENGMECYDSPPDGNYIGMAFRLDDDVFKRCCDLLNRRNPPRNAPVQPTLPDGWAFAGAGKLIPPAGYVATAYRHAPADDTEGGAQ